MYYKILAIFVQAIFISQSVWHLKHMWAHITYSYIVILDCRYLYYYINLYKRC